MQILHDVCALPTAPFVELAVIAYVRRFVAQRPELSLSEDRHGNLLIELPGRQNDRPRWVFTAHMDHPGLISQAMTDRQTLQCVFRGYVLAELVKNAKVRFFDPSGEIAGTVKHVEPDSDGLRAQRVTVRVDRPVAANVAGMFDLSAGFVAAGKFHCRCCDDLAGAAAALSMIDRLSRRPVTAPVAVLLTRAEEEGFVGAIAACRRPKLLRKTDRLIAIECSAMQPYAPQGDGPIIRVGDRTSIFDSSLTYFLTRQAERLPGDDPPFTFQRALMPGGTCEATVYNAYGFQAASICIALGNYHNMDRVSNCIAEEFVDLADWQKMVRLFLAITEHGHEYERGYGPLREKIDQRYEKLKDLLRG